MSRVQMVCVDNSKDGYKALDYYMNNIRRPDSKLLICHCQEYWGDIRPMDGPSPGTVYELKQKAQQNTKDICDRVNAQLGDAQHTFAIEETNDPYKAIVDLAAKENVSLIVMGCRGLSTVRRTLMGSVSDSVLHHAHCPVLVCRH